MVNQLTRVLPNISTNLSKWKFFFCDERVVPYDSADSTFGAYKKAFRNIVNVTEDQFVTINPDLNGKLMC